MQPTCIEARASVTTPHALAAWTAAALLAASLFSHTVALRLTLLLAGAVLCAWVIARERDVFALPPIWFPFVLWAAWAALSIAWSEDPARSAKEFRNEFGYTGFALWIGFIAGQARNAVPVVPVVVGLAAAGACAIALYSFQLGPEAYPYGLHGGSGNHSSTLLVLMPCAALAAWYGLRADPSRATTSVAAGLMLLFLASAYTTLNRTVWLGFAAQAVLIVALLAIARGSTWQRRTKVALAGIALLAIAAGSAMTLFVHGERVDAGAPAAFERDPRTTIWPESLELISERPLAGHGVGRGLLRSTLRSQSGDPVAWHSHNLFLEALLQTGVPGLALLVLLLGATVWQAWRLLRSGDELALACGIALAAVVLGMLVRNMTDMLWVRHNALLYWGVVGVLLGIGMARRFRPFGR